MITGVLGAMVALRRPIHPRVRSKAQIGPAQAAIVAVLAFSSGSEQSTGSAPTPGANSGYSGPIGGGYICNDGSVVKGISQCRDGTAAWLNHTLFNMGYQSADGDIKYYHNDVTHVFSTMRGGMGNNDIHGPWAQGYNSRFGISLTDTMSKN